MAPRRSDLRALYPQRKPLNSPTTKLSSRIDNGKDLKKEIPANSTDSATSADAAQSDSLNSYDDVYAVFAEEGDDCVEQILKQFDLDMRYGPCVGLTRIERWQRAVQLGLSPSQDVKDLLDRAGGMPNCVWEGRV